MKQVPVGVKIISILYYIGAAMSVIFAILLLVGVGTFLANLSILAIFSGLLYFTGILFLGMAVLDFFIARGLWRAQKWARIIVIVFAILAVLGGIVSLIGGNFSSIITLVISGLIGGYLLFSKSVKQVFA